MTVVYHQLLNGAKVIQTQEDDLTDVQIASTPNVIASSPAPTNKKKAVKVVGPGGG